MIPNRTDAYDLLHQGSILLAQIEENGLRIDTKYLNRTIIKIEQKAADIEAELKETKIFRTWKRIFGSKADLGSPKQLGQIIFGELGYTSNRITKTGLYATDVEAFKDVDIPFVKKYLRAKKLKNTSNTFLKGLQREVIDGYIHPMYNLNTVATYRGSCNSPNSQNIPKRDEEQAKYVRSCIIPPDGWHFWEIDFKALEVNVNASYSRDPVLMDYCSNPSKDMHRDMAALLYKIQKSLVNGILRFYAKNEFVFATFYGSYYKQIAPQMWDTLHRMKLKVGDTDELISEHLKKKGIKELGECNHEEKTREGTFEAHVRDVEREFWDVKYAVHDSWRKENYENYKKVGYIDTLTGFRVSHGKTGPLSRNDSFSYPVQGSAFHCNLWVLIQLQKWLNKYKMKTKLVGQIHDSGLGNSPPKELDDVLGKAKELITKDLLKHWDWIVVPMNADVGLSKIDDPWYIKTESKL